MYNYVKEYAKECACVSEDGQEIKRLNKMPVTWDTFGESILNRCRIEISMGL